MATVNITAAKVLGLIEQDDEAEETKRLIAKHRLLKVKRTPFHLEKADLEEICKWKLLDQVGRSKKERSKNPDDLVTAVTEEAFKISRTDRRFEAQIRVGVLCTLPFVGIGIASATLALFEPEFYAPIDYLVWNRIFQADHDQRRYSDFSPTEYEIYVWEMRRNAEEISKRDRNFITPQQLDNALWLEEIALKDKQKGKS